MKKRENVGIVGMGAKPHHDHVYLQVHMAQTGTLTHCQSSVR